MTTRRCGDRRKATAVVATTHEFRWSPLADVVGRGRVFAFVQTSARAVRMLAVSASSAAVGVGSSRHLQLGDISVPLASSRLFLVAGASGVMVGLLALRQMDDRKGIPVLADAWDAAMRRPKREPDRRSIGGRT